MVFVIIKKQAELLRPLRTSGQEVSCILLLNFLGKTKFYAVSYNLFNLKVFIFLIYLKIYNFMLYIIKKGNQKRIIFNGKV